MNTTYQTLIVKFSEPITALDGIFDDTGAWGSRTYTFTEYHKTAND
ncbi:hypothetical protein NXX11_00950 [Phocaeicola vulgatus]|nr:hypothetical protein [Phocaeicola vulgatus]MCS2730580.1 hypothetical protein [Phocaeicola vulgatus]